MREIYHNLHIGSQEDYENIVKLQDNWFVISACKEPYHRKALGYAKQGAPKDHPEYLLAYRDNHLILNLVDAPDPTYIPKQIIDEAISVIDKYLSNTRILVHCNQGMSRSATIGLLYLHHIKNLPNNFTDAEKAFLELYPSYNPGKGMREFAIENWNNY